MTPYALWAVCVLLVAAPVGAEVTQDDLGKAIVWTSQNNPWSHSNLMFEMSKPVKLPGPDPWSFTVITYSLDGKMWWDARCFQRMQAAIGAMEPFGTGSGWQIWKMWAAFTLWDAAKTACWKESK